MPDHQKHRTVFINTRCSSVILFRVFYCYFHTWACQLLFWKSTFAGMTSRPFSLIFLTQMPDMLFRKR